jgi:hypothetical protein
MANTNQEPPAEEKPDFWHNTRDFISAVSGLVAIISFLWKFLTAVAEGPEAHPDAVAALRALVYAGAVCGALTTGVGIAAGLKLNLTPKSSFLPWFAFLALPIAGAVFYFWPEDLRLSLAICGLGGLVITVVFPLLHKLRVINLYGPPPWEKRRK